MEDLNFVDTLKLKHYQETTKWIKSSIILITITVVVLKFISLTQWNKLQAIKSEINEQKLKIKDLNKVLQRAADLKKQKKILKNRFAKMSKMQATPKKEFALFLEIHKIIPPENALQSISITKKNVELSASSTKDQAATWLAQQIAKVPEIKSAKVTSMQKNNGLFVFQIKGERKK